MIGVALKGLLGRKLRAILTAFAIVLGVAMISGAFVLTDTLGKGFDGIYDESYASADAVISSKIATSTDDGGEEAPAFSANVLDSVEQLPGVRVAQGSVEDEISLTDKAGKPFSSDGIALGVAADADQSVNPLQVVTGDWPRGDGQIAIDKSTAEAQQLKVGQTVGAYGDGPVKQYEISGIVRFGSVDSLGRRLDLGVRPPHRPAPVRQARQARPDPRRREAGRVGDGARHGRSARSSPKPPR